jgi:uncharacterized membrane protein
MSDQQQQPAVYHLVAYQFAGKDRAGQVVDLIKSNQRAADYKVATWAVIEVNDRGKTKVKQMGRGGMGTAAGVSVGAVLGLLGGPAGLLIWSLGGALAGGVAGKYLGHQFDSDTLKAIGAGMAPNTSAIIVIIQDKAAEKLAAELGEYDATVLTVTLGDQVSGEVASYGAVSLGEGEVEVDADTDDAETAAA